MYELVTHPDRYNWLDGRVASIGSSDSAGILGYGFRGQNEYTIWASKCHGVEKEWKEEELKRLAKGHLAEPYIAGLLKIDHAWDVQFDPPYSFRRSTIVPYLTASLDAWSEINGELSVLEFKNVGGDAVFREWDFKKEDPPLKYSIQVQHQLLVTGFKVGYIVALYGMDTHIFEIRRNETLIDLMVRKYASFWKKVVDKTPPPMDGSDETYQTFARVFAVDRGKVAEFDDSLTQVCEEFESTKDELARVEARSKELRAKIAESIGTREYAKLTNGNWYSFKNVRNSRTLRKCKALQLAE